MPYAELIFKGKLVADVASFWCGLLTSGAISILTYPVPYRNEEASFINTRDFCLFLCLVHIEQRCYHRERPLWCAACPPFQVDDSYSVQGAEYLTHIPTLGDLVLRIGHSESACSAGRAGLP